MEGFRSVSKHNIIRGGINMNCTFEKIDRDGLMIINGGSSAKMYEDAKVLVVVTSVYGTAKLMEDIVQDVKDFFRGLVSGFTGN